MSTIISVLSLERAVSSCSSFYVFTELYPFFIHMVMDTRVSQLYFSPAKSVHAGMTN